MALNSLFRDTSVTQQSLRAFDDFISQKIPAIVATSIHVKSNFCDHAPAHTITIDSPLFGQPVVLNRDGEREKLTPNKARMRDLTYSSPLYVNIKHEQHLNNGETIVKVHENVFIARIPTMTKCAITRDDGEADREECEYDPGGYMIVNGREKVIVSQERIVPNTIMCFSSESRGVEAVIYSQMNALTKINAVVNMTFKREYIVVSITNVENLPLHVFSRALGVKDDDIRDAIFKGQPESAYAVLKNAVGPSLESDETEEQCKERLKGHSARWAEFVYPHDPTHAAKHCVDQVRLLIHTHIGLRRPDSRDAMMAKRVDTAGGLMTSLTAILWNKFVALYRKALQKLADCDKTIRADRLAKKLCNLTDGLKYSIATGNWRSKDSKGGRTGVAQALSRHTYVSCVSQLRRLDSSVPTDTKITAPRLLRGDEWGMTCPNQTPEGAPTGLVSQLSIAARVSVDADINLVTDAIADLTHKDTNGPLVYVNGTIVGGCTSPHDIRRRIIKKRRDRTLPYDIAVVADSTRVDIWCDAGRIVRPVYIVRDDMVAGLSKEVKEDLESGRSKWEDLMSMGIVEYISPIEQENLLIALSKADITRRHTHCEIHPALILGVMVNGIPFANHNQSPRNSYQCSMGKQSIGVFATTFKQRYDTNANILHYPQKALVTTKISEALHVSELPAGMNAIVAIMSHGGYNQEDSVLVNQASVDRGFARLTTFRTQSVSDVGRGQKKQVFCNTADSSYDEHGVPAINKEVAKGDVLIGRKVPINETRTRDTSAKNTKNDAIVDSAIIAQNDQGGVTVKVRVREDRIPELGDKFCYTPDHEYLTEKGWMPVAEAAVGDKIAVYDPQKQSFAYEAVEHVHNYTVSDEPMYEVESEQVSLKITLNHKLYVRLPGDRFRLVEARHAMDRGAKYMSHSPNGLDESQVWPTPCPVPSGNVSAFLFLFGIMVGKAERLKSYGLRMSVSSSERQTITETVVRCGLHPIKEDGTMSFFHKPLTDVMPGPDGRLPRWCFHLPPEDVVIMLKGMEFTGIRHDDMDRIMLHSGLPFEKKCVHRPSIVEYTGSIHCVTVRTGIVYVRRRGRTVWCGNSSRHGQKGTCGLLVPQEDMPYTRDGLVPDIIVNPHAIPSRMTIAHILECLASKVAALRGINIDATAFDSEGVNDFAEQLHSLGFQKHGNETMFSGKTGEMLPAKVFIGPTYYQRLKHMVKDKCHARGTGTVVAMTRQPSSGRRSGGGLRFGEMEKDCAVSYGAAEVLHERMLVSSDKYEASVCSNPKCGLVGTCILHERRRVCRVCMSPIESVPIPYSSKQMLMEMMAMGVAPRLPLKGAS